MKVRKPGVDELVRIDLEILAGLVEEWTPRFPLLQQYDARGLARDFSDALLAELDYIGNITVYFRRTKLLRSADILGKLFGPLLRSRIGQRGLAAIVRRLPAGPSEAERIGHQSTIWAEATDGFGKSAKAILSTPDPYDFSANSALGIASRISSLPAALGLVTPSQAFGADFVLALPGCSRAEISPTATY